MRTTLTFDNDACCGESEGRPREYFVGGGGVATYFAGRETVPKSPWPNAVFRSAGGRYTSGQVEEALADE